MVNKKSAVALSALTVLMVFLMNCHSLKNKAGNTAGNWPGYQPFPNGFGYLDTAQLKRAYEHGNIPALRVHAWSLFAGIMQPARNGTGWPVWYTWPNSVDAMEIEQIYTNSLKGAKQVQNSALIKMSQLRGTSSVSTPTPRYPIPPAVIDSYAQYHVFTNSTNSHIIPGKHFMFNGDIMIPTESISLEGYNWIHDNRYYAKSTMDSLYNQGVRNLDAPVTYVITKHMYWPVLANQLCALPVWDSSYYQNTDTGYVGYETWKRIIAIDPTNRRGSQTAAVTYLFGVQTHDSIPMEPIRIASARVHNINEFYFHKITQADWDSLDYYDKANLNASSYWAYNKPIGVGDYLVTIAMHINTKELESWTMQSAWWTDQPSVGSGSYNRPDLPAARDTTWKHYNMIDAYGIAVSGTDQLVVASNPYIELVSHPMATNCNNCHMRTGYPEGQKDSASYQSSACPDLLLKLTDTTSCLTHYTRTDFQWIIGDYTH